MEVVEIGFRSTKYYFIDTGSGLLAFDCGWHDSYREYKEGLKYKDYSIDDIKWVFVSHFHIDHAGLIGLFQEKRKEIVIFENQVKYVKVMEDFMLKKGMKFKPLDMNRIKVLKISESREFLNKINIKGEVLLTPCHSEDSISLILDKGIAFIGDLPLEIAIMPDDELCKRDWRLLREKGVRIVKPSHSPEISI